MIRVLHDDRYEITRASKRSSADITRGRNASLKWFLSTDNDYLWMLDTDMVFAPSVPQYLIQQDLDIVSALYYGQNEDESTFPVFSIKKEDGYLRPGVSFDVYNVRATEVAGVGMGCCVIHREVIEKLWTGDPLWPFAEIVQPNGQPTEDDITFCLRAREQGFRTFVLGSCEVRHAKDHLI